MVYIAGAERSGSTLLGRILGKNPESVFVGELKAISSQIQCECGETAESCTKWAKILRRTDIGVLEKSKNNLRSASLIFRRPEIEHLDSVYEVYKEIANVFGKKIIIDSSKTPLHMYCLKKCSGINLSIIHLVRDPRAVCDSLWRKPIRFDKEYRPITERSIREIILDNPIRNSILWVERNYLIEKISENCNHYLMKYENFCENPDRELKNTSKNLNREIYNGGLEDGRVDLKRKHSLGGNTNKFIEGCIKIEKRQSWVRGSHIVNKFLCGLISGIWMKRYGYL